MHTEDNVAIISVSAPGSAITGQLEMPRPGLSSATNTSVPGPPELPGDGPGWFTQMRAELEMRDERREAFTALDNWTMQHHHCRPGYCRHTIV